MRLLNALILIMSFICYSMASTQTKTIEHPFLWKVEKGEQHFYLFGTMHLADPLLQTLPKALKEAIDKSDIVRTEIPLDIKTQLKASTMMMRDDNQTLKDILSNKLYNRTQKYLQGINPKLTLASFEHIKIWAVATIVSMIENQLKYPFLQAIDDVIYNYAKEQKKDIGGVETLDEQLGVMDSFSFQEQILELESTLDYLDKETDFGYEMKKLYISGNSKKLMDFINKSMFQMPKYTKLEEKFMQRLLYNRNIRMAQRLERIVTQNPHKKSLFAFGVMHFLGKKSIIEILKSHGYRVQRL